MDAVPNKATKFRLVNRLRDAQKVRDRKRSGQHLVLSNGRSCGHYPSNFLSLSRESYWEDFVTGIDCHTDVYRRLQRFWNFIHSVRMSCTNSRFLTGTYDFSTAYGSTHFTIDNVFFIGEARFDAGGYINSQNSRICNAENSPHVSSEIVELCRSSEYEVVYLDGE